LPTTATTTSCESLPFESEGIAIDAMSRFLNRELRQAVLLAARGERRRRPVEQQETSDSCAHVEALRGPAFTMCTTAARPARQPPGTARRRALSHTLPSFQASRHASRIRVAGAVHALALCIGTPFARTSVFAIYLSMLVLDMPHAGTPGCTYPCPAPPTQLSTSIA